MSMEIYYVIGAVIPLLGVLGWIYGRLSDNFTKVHESMTALGFDIRENYVHNKVFDAHMQRLAEAIDERAEQLKEHNDRIENLEKRRRAADREDA